MVQGMTQSYLGYHDKAILIYEEALRETPSSATLNSALAESHEHLGDFSSALLYASQALLLDPSEIHFHRHLIHLHIQTDDFTKAEDLLENLILIFPEDIPSLEDLVEIQTLNGKQREALDTHNRLISLEGQRQGNLEIKLHLLKVLQEWPEYETTLVKLSNISPGNVTYMRELALFYVSQGRPQDAIEILENATQVTLTDPSLTSMLARLYEKEGYDEEAQKLYERQTNTPVNDPQAAYQKALQLVTSQPGEDDAIYAAQELLRKAIELSPDHVEANTLLGTLFYESGQFFEARVLLRKAVDLNPRAQDTWLIAADAFYQSFDYQEARTLTQDALLLFPGQLPFLDLAAKINFKLFMLEDALQYLNEFLELLTSHTTLTDLDKVSLQGEALAFAGLIHGFLEQPAPSDSMLTIALEIQPQNAQVLSKVALSLAEQQRDLSKALDLATQATKLDSGNSEFLEILGRVYYRQNKLGEAEQCFRQIIQSGYSSPVTYEYLGDLLLKVGKPTEAIASWTKSLELSPNNPIILEKLRTHSN